MKAESREMLLWAAAVVLGIAVGLFAMLSAPDFAPEGHARLGDDLRFRLCLFVG